MASTSRKPLSERYGDGHLTYEEIRELGLKVVTEKGETVPTDELQGKVFRIVDKDDASGYVVSPTEGTGTATVLPCRHRSRTRFPSAERDRTSCLETGPLFGNRRQFSGSKGRPSGPNHPRR